MSDALLELNEDEKLRERRVPSTVTESQMPSRSLNAEAQIPCFIRFILYNYVAYFFFIDSSMLDFPSCTVKLNRILNQVELIFQHGTFHL
jgi:hypothetical protein